MESVSGIVSSLVVSPGEPAMILVQFEEPQLQGGQFCIGHCDLDDGADPPEVEGTVRCQGVEVTVAGLFSWFLIPGRRCRCTLRPVAELFDLSRETDFVQEDLP